MDEELKKLIEDIKRGFEEYKKTNDARLDEIKKGGSGGELEAKLAKIEADIAAAETKRAELEAKLNRPGRPNETDEETEQKDYSKLFNGWLRKGKNTGELESKSVNITEGTDGGYAVPAVVSNQIYSLLRQATPMRQLCRQINIGTSDYSELVDAHGEAGGWVGETDARTATATGKLYKVAAILGELYANPQATQQSLDDMFFDVEAWLSGAIADTFRVMENAAFTAGDGLGKPKGLFAYPTAATADATRAFGTFEHVKSGANGAFGANAYDNLIDLIETLKEGHLLNASFMMTRGVRTLLRKAKDGDGNYVWEPSVQKGTPAMILGYPVIVNDDVPALATGSLSMAFGDFAKAYTICDRIGMRMLRDPFTNKPNVGFYTTKRVGAFAKDTEAVKFMKFSA